MLKLYDFAVNAVLAPTFIPASAPSLSWKLNSDRENVRQTTYRVTVTAKDGDVFFDTGIVASAASVHVKLAADLTPRTDYIFTVTVTDNHGETATLTHTCSTTISSDEWGGVWIQPKRHIEGWAPYLRTKFTCEGTVTRARLYVCGLGCGEYTINGHLITEDRIDPPITNYEKEIYYRVYDVKELLGEKNTLVALLGEGWYSQSRVWGMHGMKYGNVCLLARLDIDFADGTTKTVVTNTDDWMYKYSPVILNNIYAGETYDARLETPDLDDFDGDEEEWGAVIEDTTPKGELKYCEMPAVRVIRKLPAVSVKTVSGICDGAWIVDFGENVSGVVEIHIPPSPRGAQYTIRTAETLNRDGTLDHRSVGTFATQCIQQDIYMARGDAEGEVWHPRFTYHGFRYMEITGYHNLRAYGLNPELTFAACLVLSTDLRRTGSFTCSHADLSHLQNIMLSSFLSNYHGLPEDCPAREKCGWLGDAQIACNFGMMNFDMEASYRKYLGDIRTTDDVYGVWQMVSPGKRGCLEASPLWGCANVIIPYWMYRYYGDPDIIRDNWENTERWMAHEIADAKHNAPETGSDFIITRGLGDWCPPQGNYHNRRMPIPESSTAIFFVIANLMHELACELGLSEAVDYEALAAAIKKDFNARFWLPKLHRYSTWGTCGVALMTGLYPDGEQAALTCAALELMAADNYNMPTGIYGNKYLVPALSERGYGDIALRYLFTREHVSFGTMLDDGATSLWECIQNKNIGQPREQDTPSFNHPMHAGFAYFMYAHIGGIKPLKPGFAEFEISPCRFTDIPDAEVSHICPYGEIKLAFHRTDSITEYHLTVPENTTAHFRVGTFDEVLGSGTYIRTVKA